MYLWSGSSDSGAKIRFTANSDTGAAGWSIENGRLNRPQGSAYSNYAAVAGPLRIKVEGTTNPEVLISISDATATEGVGATMDFDVTLNRSWTRTVTVEWTTGPGTATGNVDFREDGGTLTFQPGETRKTISVAVLDDSVNDSGETFSVSILTYVSVYYATLYGHWPRIVLRCVPRPPALGMRTFANTLQRSAL